MPRPKLRRAPLLAVLVIAGMTVSSAAPSAAQKDPTPPSTPQPLGPGAHPGPRADPPEGCEPVSPIDLVSNPALAIPDAGSEVTDTLDVSDDLVITDVDVDVILTHTWIGDLAFSVTPPGGAPLVLWSKNCNSGLYEDIDTVFDDAGTAEFCNPGGPTPDPSDGNGRIIPLGITPLSSLNDTTSLGTWTFAIQDLVSSDTGTLEQWSLHIEGCVVPEPTPTAPRAALAALAVLLLGAGAALLSRRRPG